MSARHKLKFIPEKIYKKIIRDLPLCCVDVLPVYEGRFLLVKRNKSPAKNQWWLIGGRLIKGETLLACAKRKLAEEISVKKVKSVKFLGVGVNNFRNGHFGTPYHAVNITHLAVIDGSQIKNIKIDGNHSEYRWFCKAPPGISSYVKKFIKAAGFK